MEIQLGDKVRCLVTGLEGIAIGYLRYLNGCVQFCVKPRVNPEKEMKSPDGEWIDVGQLELVEVGAFALRRAEAANPAAPALTGGPGECPPVL